MAGVTRRPDCETRNTVCRSLWAWPAFPCPFEMPLNQTKLGGQGHRGAAPVPLFPNRNVFFIVGAARMTRIYVRLRELSRSRDG